MSATGELSKSTYGNGLSMSQVWCDVLNFLVGLSCIINGFRGECCYDSQVFFFTGNQTQNHKPTQKVIFQDWPTALSP